MVGHLWQQPPGAFAVLDMFFVLSGFLITPILVNGLAEHGARFTAAFYLNRVRRLFPAAVLVIVVTTLLFYVVYSGPRGRLVATDGAWALVFLVNWHFISVGTDYFHDHTPSPFVHYWSLSIEEQFYAVWPFLIIAVLLLARQAHRRSPVGFLLAALSLVTVVSFAYSLWLSSAAPLAAYFSTFDRVWEFGIGGLLGVLGPRLARMPQWLGVTLGWGGCLGILVTVFVLPLGLPFPAPYGLIPVLLTGAILVGGIGRDTRYLFIVDNRPIIYLGDISYSLYLWHLPLAVLLTAWFPLGDPLFYLSAIVLSFGAAIATYHLVERPLRYSRRLMTPPERARYRRPSPQRLRRGRRAGWVALACTSVSALCVAALAPQMVSAAGPVEHPTPAVVRDPTPVDLQQARIVDALEATAFPDLDPPIDELGTDSWIAAEDEAGCVVVTASMLDECSFGHGPRLAVVVGDSYAVSWMPGIREALDPDVWTVQQLTLTQCPAWTLPSYRQLDRSSYPECTDHHELVESEVRDRRPDLLILASAYLNVRNAERTDLEGDGEDVARRGLGVTLERLSPSAGRTVVLGSPPGQVPLVECVSRVGTPEDCVSELTQEWRDAQDGESAAAAAAGARYVSTRDWFCSWGRCPAFVGSTPVAYDGGHLTIAYSRELAPLIREALVGTPSGISP